MGASQVSTEDERINKTWYNGILLSFKKKEILTHTAIWMKPEDVMLREISQSQKDKYHDSTYTTYMSYLVKFT